MRDDPELVRKPCYLQAWLLHVVYGFYFTADSSSASRNMLHILVDVSLQAVIAHSKS